jgi:hypothetical protein
MGSANQPMTFNRWAYVNGNPVNFSDPSGRYSAVQIAESYGLTVTQLILAAKTGRYVSELHNKWGWINLLLDAHDGQTVQIGSPALFPPFLDMYPKADIKSDHGKITIGGKGLLAYTYAFLDNPLSPVIWWRNTKPSYYYLDSAEYFDATHDLPAFRTINADLLFLGELNPVIAVISQLADVGGALTIDRYGNVYASFSGMIAPSIGGSPISVGEGYINSNPAHLLSAIMGQGAIPTEAEIIGTLTKWCVQGGVNVLTGSFQGALCGGRSSAFMYGYTLSVIGDSIGPSFTFDPIAKIPALSWDYLDRKSGVSSSEVLNKIKLDMLINGCP